MVNELPGWTSSFLFGVEIEGLVVGWFTRCAGLEVTREVLPYEEGGTNDYVHQLPGRIRQVSLTLQRGIADAALWEWFYKGLYDGQVQRRNVSIILYDADGAHPRDSVSSPRRWNLIDALPVSWQASDLQAGENLVAVESLKMGVGGDSEGGMLQMKPDGEEEAEPAEMKQGKDLQGVNLARLTQKVYDLLKQDLRVERERQGH